ncbi:DUF3800 domain-containing protein [Flavobacteriaceae bacterium]|nr:DUF3800 domain-containing protein [Flavobacteriaceae bacterium]
MSIVFGFSDESGDYRPKRSENWVGKVPFYVRGTLLIDAENWKELFNRFNFIKRKYDLPDEEIKWSYLWSLRSHQKTKAPVRDKEDYAFLKDFEYHHLIDYVEETLSILNQINSAEVVITLTSNKANNKFSLDHLFEMHIRSLLQRTEYGMNGDLNGFATLFFDPIDTKVSKRLRDTYQKIYKSGDFVKNYKHLKDSLNLEFSHHSVGIQVADFISGCTIGYLKQYSRSIQIFNKNIKPNLRTYLGKIVGAGIIEVPTNKVVRKNIEKIMKENN